MTLGSPHHGANPPAGDAMRAGQAGLVRAYCADAETLMYQDRLEEARALALSALRLAPRDAAALNILGVIDLQRGDFKAAAQSIRRSAELQPGAPEPRHYLGLAFEYMGRYEEAIESFQAALGLRPGVVSTLFALGKMLKILGRNDEACEAYRRIIEANCGEVLAYLYLAELAPRSLSAAHLACLEKLADDTAIDPSNRAFANFALATVHESNQEFDAGFLRLRQANDLLRDRLTSIDGRTGAAGVVPIGQRPNYTTPAKALERIVDMRSYVETTFNADFIHRYAGSGHPSELPIFIVGMPRSGSSLIEQILSSHPAVHGAGEIDTFHSRIVGLHWPYQGYLQADGSGRLRPSEPRPRHFRICGAEYVKALREMAPRAGRIINKMPGNYMHVGMIHLCLPNAIIINSVRDPVDTCLGSYKRHFLTGNETTYDLGLIGRHYREYRRMMAHWQRVLPSRVIDVVHEDLVADPEAEIRRLLERCRLPWDARCLHPEKNSRPVLTSSVTQVRQPIHRGAVQHWRNYRRHLGPLFEALGPYAPVDIPPARSNKPGEPPDAS